MEVVVKLVEDQLTLIWMVGFMEPEGTYPTSATKARTPQARTTHRTSVFSPLCKLRFELEESAGFLERPVHR